MKPKKHILIDNIARKMGTNSAYKPCRTVVDLYNDFCDFKKLQPNGKHPCISWQYLAVDKQLPGCFLPAYLHKLIPPAVTTKPNPPTTEWQTLPAIRFNYLAAAAKHKKNGLPLILQSLAINNWAQHPGIKVLP